MAKPPQYITIRINVEDRDDLEKLADIMTRRGEMPEGRSRVFFGRAIRIAVREALAKRDKRRKKP